MNMIALADMHGKVPDIRKEKFDAILGAGDYCKFSEIRKAVFKYGEEWEKIIGKRKAREMKKRAFESGRDVIRKLASYGKPVIVIPGNTDMYRESGRYSYKKMLRENNVIDINGEAVELEGVYVVGYGGTSGPEIENEDDMEMFQTLYSHYASIMESVDPEKTIFISHVPPYGSGLDKIKNRKSPMNGISIGSFLAREIIRNYHPKIVLSGHVHESKGRKRYGKTVAINIGPAFLGNYAVISAGKSLRAYMKSR